MVLRGEEAIFGFLIVQAKRRKRRREEIQVWNSHICYYGTLVWKLV